jgi:hypothetical protein
MSVTTFRIARAGGATALLAGLLAGGAAVHAAGASRAVPRAATAAPAATAHRVLFDDTKAETAGNADWIVGTSIPDPTQQDASPQVETDWTGAISAWGVALQRTGQYQIDTLGPGGTITYGTSAALDLSHFDEFVLPEPNVRLSAAEKTAVMQFVQHGGGLFVIVDHTGSDRNNDGYDSPKIANDLMTSNGVDSTDPFGFSVDLVDISNENPRAVSDATSPVLHGPFGTVTGSIIRDGTTFTLKPADNAAVRGLVYRTSVTSGGTTGAAFVTSTFGSGRVAMWDDSSPIDDGTGQSGNTLFNGWNDPAGTDAALALNTTAWLAGTGSSGGGGGTCTAGQLVANGGFETGTAASWTTAGSPRVTSGSAEPPHAGNWDAWLDGRGATGTDTLSQTVTIPAGCTTATLGYWLHVDTVETTTSTAYDTLTVRAGSATVATYSNLNHATGYTHHTVDLGGYAGQAVTLAFGGAEDYTKQTSFVLDDVTLNVSA